MLTADAIKTQARTLGFDACGIAPATDLPELHYLQEWLASGYAGQMEYMHKSAETRGDIRRFLPAARSVIVTGTIYYTADAPAPSAEANAADQGPAVPVRIARYARGADYHLVLAERLAVLLAWMRQQHAEPFEAEVFVDKHHVQERVYARHAGLGWIGKNSCLISPELGSWMLLAGIATSLPLAPDNPGFDHCGACTICLDACPTGALVGPHQLDATRCISYLTIELPGPIPAALRPAVDDHLWGCDVCQDVCPWNLAPTASPDPAWQPQRNGEDARELWQRSDQGLHALVAQSAMTHAPLARLRRNLAVILGNSGQPDAVAVLDRPGGGVKNAAHSAHTPIVAEAVAAAREALTPPPTDR